MKKILELKSITAVYGNTIILKDVNLVVYEKDFLGIIGPNGGGKTTLLKIILGQINPVKGKVKFFISPFSKNKNFIGYLPQVKLFDRKFPITVLDVILSGLISKVGIFKKFTTEHKKQAEELLDKMSISYIKNKAIGELSGGQLQRVFLCRALISSPKLLILDEPNTFVDQNFGKDLFETLKKLNKKMAIIMVSHDIGVISSYVKNIACVNGMLYYHGLKECTQEMIDKVYKCPVDIITHGEVAHRVLKKHGEKNA